MKPRLFFYALTSALAGFLFGFDTVVISGAEQTIQTLWQLGDFQHGLAMSMALWGTVVGALLGGWPTEKWGRTRTLQSIGILYVVSAIWSGLATDVYAFMIARLIGGVGVGISTVAAPLYISEISPPAFRGRLAGMFQFNIVFGILVAFLSNALLAGIGEQAWRWMLAVEAFPALIFTALCFVLPESPRWLISHQGDETAALKAFKQINPSTDPIELQLLVAEITESSAQSNSSAVGFWSLQLRTPILLAFLVAFFNQLSGINAILYFAPRIFELTGLSAQAALLQSIGIGCVNLVFTFVGLYLIDRLGRRTLLIIGSFGYIASLGLCAYTFFANAVEFRVASAAIQVSDLALKFEASPDAVQGRKELDESLEILRGLDVAAYRGPDFEVPVAALPADIAGWSSELVLQASEAAGAGGVIVLICIFAFIAAHAVGQGAVIWVLISEIFPTRYRAMGQSLGSFTHWIFAALLTLSFPQMVTYFSPGTVFGFFCFMMVLQLVWVWLMVPETKGVPLEELQSRLGLSSTPPLPQD